MMGRALPPEVAELKPVALDVWLTWQRETAFTSPSLSWLKGNVPGMAINDPACESVAALMWLLRRPPGDDSLERRYEAARQSGYIEEPMLPWSQLLPEQRDLARRLAGRDPA